MFINVCAFSLGWSLWIIYSQNVHAYRNYTLKFPPIIRENWRQKERLHLPNSYHFFNYTWVNTVFSNISCKHLVGEDQQNGYLYRIFPCFSSVYQAKNLGITDINYSNCFSVLRTSPNMIILSYPWQEINGAVVTETLYNDSYFLYLVGLWVVKLTVTSIFLTHTKKKCFVIRWKWSHKPVSAAGWWWLL